MKQKEKSFFHVSQTITFEFQNYQDIWRKSLKRILTTVAVLTLCLSKGKGQNNAPPMYLGGGFYSLRTSDKCHGFVYNAGVDGQEFRGSSGFVWKTGQEGANTRMQMNSSGFLGIGNTNPSYILDVSGQVRLRAGAGQSAGLLFMNSISTNDVAFMGLMQDGYLGWWGSGNNLFGLVTSVNSGNVGINNNYPSYKLHLTGSATLNGTALFLQTPTTSNEIACLRLANEHGTVRDRWSLVYGNNISDAGDKVVMQALLNDTRGNGVFSIKTATSGNLTEKLRINEWGQVAIGTSIATEMLTVNGKVKCGRLITDASKFPDYVFDKGYSLPHLTDIKKYINENGRMPGMPAADKLIASGMNLTEVQTLTVEKIEELYLHLISLEEIAKELEQKFLITVISNNK